MNPRYTTPIMENQMEKRMETFPLEGYIRIMQELEMLP